MPVSGTAPSRDRRRKGGPPQKAAMVSFVVRRFLLAILTIWVISALSFVIIQLPPGDFVTTYIAQLSASGGAVSAQEAEALHALYGLNQPFYVQYYKWMVRILT